MTSILDRFRFVDAEPPRGVDARQLVEVEPNGHAGRIGYVLTTAEQAPCTCPEFCERDHGNE